MLRRSGALLKGLGGGHRELHLTLTQLAAAKESLRASAKEHQEAFEDMDKWAQAQDNRALQDTLGRMSELMAAWAKTQLAVSAAFKELRQEFSMVLEGEKTVDKAKAQLQTAEGKEATVRKEVRRRSSASPSAASASSLLAEAERSTSEARTELTLVQEEQEAVKMLRVKNGLLKVTQGLQEASEKGRIIVEAAQVVVEAIPTLTDATKSVQDIRYTAAPITLQAVMRAKERLDSWSPRKKKRNTLHSASASALNERQTLPEHPPPYTETQPPHNPYFS